VQRRHLPLWCAALALAATALPPAASAQVVQVPEADIVGAAAAPPVVLAQPSIGLSGAVELALKHNPAIARSVASLRLADGRAQQARGLFDPTLRVLPSATFDLKEMAPFLKAREMSKRETIRIIRDNFTILTKSLREMIEVTSTTPPRCPSGLTFTNGQLDLTGLNLDPAGRDEAEVELLGVDRQIQSVLVELGEGLTIDISDICSTQPRDLISPELLIGTYRKIDQSGGLGLQGILDSVAQIPREMRILQEEISRTVAYRAALALDRLGPIAEDELKRNITIEANFSKVFRNGLQFGANYQVQSQEQNFVDKPLDPTFGGFETPPQFFSSASATLTLPLARGRGSDATAASERAAVYMAEGEREQFLHTVSEEVFRTVLSYLNLVAAQETVRQLEASLGRQQQILNLSQGLVNAGDMAQADLARVRAGAAGVEGSLAQARGALVAARVALAEQMGVHVTTLDGAPIAAQAFADTQAPLAEANTLIESALATRRDLRAANARRDAAAALAAGARAGARPLLDFTLTAGMANLYDSPFFKYLPDERLPIISTTTPVPTPPVTGTPVPPLSAVRYYDARGYGRAMTGRYEPFATVAITFELPFGNNAARGRAAQAEAALNTSSIQTTDLRRTIGDSIVDLSQALRRSAEALQHRQNAVTQGNETLGGRIKLLQAGDTTLIDVLTTEEELRADELAVVRQRQAYLSALARIKLELGQIAGTGAGAAEGVVRFDPAEFTR
jgi:outer membrane protein TolC